MMFLKWKVNFNYNQCITNGVLSLISPSQAPAIIREYFIYIETIKGKSAATADGYFRDLRTFFRFLKVHYGLVDKKADFQKIDITDIDINFIKRVTLQDAYEFLIYCKYDRDNNERTRARKTSTLKSFFNYLTTRMKYLDVNPILELDAPKAKKTLPKHLTLEQSIRVLGSIDGEFKERNEAIITLFLNCGMRLAELCSLNLNSVNFEDKTMILTGKGSKERLVYLNNACIDALKVYLNARSKLTNVKDKKALFISRNGNRISRRMVQQIVYDILKKCGLDGQGLSVHKLRHTAATLMYQHGNVDIRILKEILGHENLGTTEIYTHISNEQIKQASDSNPLSNIKTSKRKAPEQSRG